MDTMKYFTREQLQESIHTLEDRADKLTQMVANRDQELASTKELWRSAEDQVARLIADARPVAPVAYAPQLSASTHPLVSGLLDYAPNALAAVAAHSKYGNDKHNGAGTPLHWAFCKSMHHADAVLTHLVQRGTVDPETGKTHTIALVWRAIMLLETELIQAGAQPGRAVDFSDCSDTPAERRASPRAVSK
jgi:hypothetical protein